MEIDSVPVALRGRLGTDATAGLLEVLEESQTQAREAVIAPAPDRKSVV